MAERQRAITSARELAERSASEARLAVAEFDRKTSEARAELYKQMDEMRRTALDERAAIMSRTRAEAEAEIASASARLQAEADEARRRLSTDADVLGAAGVGPTPCGPTLLVFFTLWVSHQPPKNGLEWPGRR